MFHFRILKPLNLVLLLRRLNNNNNNNTLSPKCCYHPFNSFSTSTSDQQSSFTVSYFTNNLGLSPPDALKLSNRVHFNHPHKPDSVISFFTNYGFSNSHIQSIILRVPELILADPTKNLLPKFQFLASKGASSSDIVATVTRSPRFLRVSLDNQIIPAFDLIRSFCPSDKKALSCVVACPTSISDNRMIPNINFLLREVGVTPSGIYTFLTTRPSTLCSNDLKSAVEEIKALGFHPSKYHFIVALSTKKAITKSQWDAKVNAFNTWGYSEDTVLNAFKKSPHFMMRSPQKLNAVMSFWIGKLGWDPLVLTSAPLLFGFSLQKRLIPRAAVLTYLLSNGLIKKGASLATPFCLTEELFLKRFVKSFEEETSSKLLRLYQGES